MHQDIGNHLYRMIDEYVNVEDLNKLLKSFIANKEEEQSSWAKITLCTHYMLGGDSPHIHRFAAVTELINLTLDIVDDLQDQDQADKPWMQSPQASTLNAILAMLMSVVGELGHMQIHGKLLVEVAQIIARSINGQHKDIINSSASVDDYLIMTQEKSGSLFRLACFIGYVSLECPAETIEQLHELADCIGLIHQIQNDMRDILRFDIKNDLRSKKNTLPILYLLKVEDEAFNPLKDYYAGKITLDTLLHNKEGFIQMIHDSGCLEYSRVVQSVCLQKAEEIFRNLQAIEPWKERFRSVTYGDFLEI